LVVSNLTKTALRSWAEQSSTQDRLFPMRQQDR